MNRAHTKSVLNVTVLQKRVYIQPRIFICQGTQVTMRTTRSHFVSEGERSKLHSSGNSQQTQQEKASTLESRFEHSALLTNLER